MSIISALLLVAFGIGALHLAIPFFRQKIRGDKVYLTLDDGPDPVNTPKILDALRGHVANATFYVIGEAVEKHPEIVKRIEAEGHALGSHGYQHLHPWESSLRASFHDIKKGIVALSEIGFTSSLWRGNSSNSHLWSRPRSLDSRPSRLRSLQNSIHLEQVAIHERNPPEASFCCTTENASNRRGRTSRL